MSETYFASHAWLPDGPASNARITVDHGRIAAVHRGTDAEADDVRLPGVVLPGFANAHSHAFHRALRGRTHDGGGTFWTWRQRMYAVAAQLDPGSYFTLARAAFAEMASAGITCVGEFHYLHHAPGGVPYADANAMGHALISAAADAGIRITLLDTCYLSGGLSAAGHLPLDDVQRRFSDGDAERWANRVTQLTTPSHALAGTAIHSVRAVPKAELGRVVRAARGGPLHVHLSEQPAENDQCLAHYGVTPTRLLRDAGALGPETTAVHATHLTTDDIADLGMSRTVIGMCPTTERDLADGIGPARALRDAGSPVVLGTDQHAVVDLIEEARSLETDERLASLHRGRFSPSELVDAMTHAGHRALGWTDAGRIEVGARADLVAVRLDSVRTAGSSPDQVVMTASAADVDTVIVDGRVIVEGGQHVLGDVGRLLTDAIAPFWT